MKSIMKIWIPIGAAILFSLQPLKRTPGMAFLFLAAASALSNPTPSSDAIIASASSDSIRVAVFGPDLKRASRSGESPIPESPKAFTLILFDEGGNPTRSLWKVTHQGLPVERFLLALSKDRQRVALTYQIGIQARLLVLSLDSNEVVEEEHKAWPVETPESIQSIESMDGFCHLARLLSGLGQHIRTVPFVTGLVEEENGEWSLIAKSGSREYRFSRNPSGKWDAEPVE